MAVVPIPPDVEKRRSENEMCSISVRVCVRVCVHAFVHGFLCACVLDWCIVFVCQCVCVCVWVRECVFVRVCLCALVRSFWSV